MDEKQIDDEAEYLRCVAEAHRLTDTGEDPDELAHLVRVMRIWEAARR